MQTEQRDNLDYWLWELKHLQPFWEYAPRKLFSVLSHLSCISHHTWLKASSWGIWPEGVSSEEKSTKEEQETRKDNSKIMGSGSHGLGKRLWGVIHGFGRLTIQVESPKACTGRIAKISFKALDPTVAFQYMFMSCLCLLLVLKAWS